MKQNGDTNRKLALKFQYGESTVYSYLNGTREITQDFLISVAQHYGIPLKKLSKERLTKDDVSKLYDFVNEEEYQRYGECLFLLQDNTLNSDEFNNAIKYFNQIDLLENLSRTLVKKCREMFYTSFINDGILEGAANTLMLILLEFSLLCMSSEFFESAILGTTKNIDVQNEIEKQLSKESKDFITNTNAMYNECLIALKNSSDNYDLYEYYLAMKFIFSFVDNGKTRKSNATIGCELLMQCYDLGNKYAIEYIDMLKAQNT